MESQIIHYSFVSVQSIFEICNPYLYLFQSQKSQEKERARLNEAFCSILNRRVALSFNYLTKNDFFT